VTELRTKLDEGLERLGLDLPDAARNGLIAYVELLAKWNRTYNLTAVRAPGAMVPRHLLDSLTLVPHLHGGRVLDVGTGPGLPGIPLALASPDRKFVLLDSNAKKTRFLTQVKAELGLENLSVVHCRAEAYRPEAPFTTITARAVTSLSGLFAACRHLLAPDGVLLAMKGARPEAELAELPPAVVVLRVEPLSVPGEGAARHVVCLAQKRMDKEDDHGPDHRSGKPEGGSG